MRIILILAIIILLGYGGAISYFYMDSFQRNRQLNLSLGDTQDAKKGLNEKVSQLDKEIEGLRKENERFKKESFDSLKLQKDVSDKQKQLEKILKQQIEEFKQAKSELDVAKAELKNLKTKNLALTDAGKFASGVQFKMQEEKVAKLKKELLSSNKRLKEQEALTHYNLGVGYTRDKNYEMAIEEYEKAISLSPKDPDSYYNLAILYEDWRKNPKRAVQYYKKYLELKPTAADIDEVREWISRLEQ